MSPSDGPCEIKSTPAADQGHLRAIARAAASFNHTSSGVSIEPVCNLCREPYQFPDTFDPSSVPLDCCHPPTLRGPQSNHSPSNKNRAIACRDATGTPLELR